MSNTIRVMIVDDHAVVRSGLSTFLLTCDDMELVGEAGSGEQALRLCSQARPDVVLMDLVMPGMDGATTTRLIREQCPEIQVVALTSFKERDLVQGPCRPAPSAICSRISQPTSWPARSARPTRVSPPWPARLLRC